MTPHERVLAMVQAGTISDAEGRRLLQALADRSAWWVVLFNPFDLLSPRTGWTIAAIVFLASLALSPLGLRFDGALDLHLAPRPSWALALFDQASAILITAGCFWMASLAAARRGRLVDFVMAIAIARAPLCLLALWIVVTLPPGPELMRQAAAGAVSPRVLLGVVAGMPFLAWFIALLYRGFSVCAGLKGAKAGVPFTLALVAAEIVTKLVLMVLGLVNPLQIR